MKYLISITLFLLSSAALAQVNVIELQNYEEADAYVPAVAINAKNEDNIVIAVDPDLIMITTNGGKNWQNKILDTDASNSKEHFMLSDKKGNFFYLFKIGDNVTVLKSNDDGQTWNHISNLPFNIQDDFKATLDQKGNIYISWIKKSQGNTEVVFTTSSNGGKKWTDPQVINSISKGNASYPIPAVDMEEKLYVSWYENGKIMLDRSYDKGKMWLRNDIEVVNFTTGDQSVIPEDEVFDLKPFLIADNSPTVLNGMLHILWTDQTNGIGNKDIWFTNSHNGGDLWSNRTKVNQNTAGNQFMPWMAQDNETGFIYITYYDQTSENKETDVYLAWSKNGGKTFENIRISEESFILKDNYLGGVQLAVDKGVIVPVWLHYDGENTKVLTTVIKQDELENKVGQ